MWAVQTGCFVPPLRPVLPDWTRRKMVETKDNWRADERERHAGGEERDADKGRQSGREVEMK